MTPQPVNTPPAVPADERILSVNGLHVDYVSAGERFPAVRGVSFSIPRGKIVAIVGESGSGKSTISQSLIRSLSTGGRITAGTIMFDGADLASAGEKTLRNIRGARIGFVPQDPSNSLNPLMKIGEQIAEALRLHGKSSKSAAAARAVEILDEVGIPDAPARAGQYPHQLSGGMRQRVLIGMAWACNPDLVIADEPTSALDVTVQRQVLDRMERLAAERGTAVLLVTHDLAVAADRADEILVMQHGRIVEAGSAQDVLANPAHEYTQRLVAAAPGLNSARLQAQPLPSGSAGPLGSSLFAGRDAAVAPGVPVLEVRNLVKTFALRTPGAPASILTAVNNVSFAVERGQTLSIVGESGSGKTTTARIAARIAGANSGTVLFDGEDVTELRGEKLRQLRRRIQVVYQNPFGSLDPRMSLEKIITEPLRAFKLGDRKRQAEAARELLECVQLSPDLINRRPGQLSGGQRQRVAIARALALGPEMIVLDEPVSALDVSVQEQILQLLVDLQSQFNLSYLFISHDLGVIRQVSDQILVMRFGDVIEAGPAEQILNAPAQAYTRELLESIPGQLQGAP
ncbi:ABC-type dipeptide/oligopeptide/nickel transport system, ATPase component [Arthrobacter sp. PAMC 25486]|uniref:dipeptide ABC transporter ATP-binding protein n=1 Tax=Arthrobacter sp. PAMC 25486 TaxID=1494608 RepID=UPI00053634AC|nr:ABC transporter ATP-binding protein [Arthrobacter sp. PAMC 25486]AIY02285.1 ABC-type dipeptide/oligopeptide/nickel transport system, ATPase component [Arthrobacter sp. PAMC 25486]